MSSPKLERTLSHWYISRHRGKSRCMPLVWNCNRSLSQAAEDKTAVENEGTSRDWVPLDLIVECGHLSRIWTKQKEWVLWSKTFGQSVTNRAAKLHRGSSADFANSWETYFLMPSRELSLINDYKITVYRQFATQSPHTVIDRPV